MNRGFTALISVIILSGTLTVICAAVFVYSEVEHDSLMYEIHIMQGRLNSQSCIQKALLLYLHDTSFTGNREISQVPITCVIHTVSPGYQSITIETSSKVENTYTSLSTTSPII